MPKSSTPPAQNLPQSADARAEYIAQQCENASPTKDGWKACCPAHDDDTPSLSITPSTDKILLCCHAGCTNDAVVAALGLTMADLFIRPPTHSTRARRGKQLGPVDKVYDYVDAHGALLFQTVRYRAPKDFRQRRPDPAKPGAYRWDLRTIEPVLYHLPDLLEAVQRDEVLYLCEGEKDVDALKALGLAATCNPMGAGKWRDSYSETLRGAWCALLPDNDTPGQEHAALVTRSLHGIAAGIKVVDLPGLPDHGDVSDWLQAGGTRPALEAMVKATALWAPAAGQTSTTLPTPQRGRTQGEELVRLGRQATLLKTWSGQRYAHVTVNDHYEILSITERGSGFRSWLLRQYQHTHDNKLPNADALSQAIAALAAEARFDAPLATIHTRIAWDNHTLYLDLANEAWEAVAIDAAGWRVVHHPPVYFRRPPGMLPLPYPDPAGTMADFYPLLPLPPASDEAKLITAWTLGAFLPEGAYTHLAIHGEQGSSKSTLTAMLRRLIDPNTAVARSAPKEERDLFLAAQNGAIVALENLSHVPDWLSDALCCLSTGAGLSTRKLYTDDEETIFAVKRPVVLNGIAEVATRGDLIDRCLFVTLPQIADEKRQAERALWEHFAQHHAQALGGILKVVSAALTNLSTMKKFPQLPRMADFAEWIEAAAPALDWKRGEFLTLYATNRQKASSIELEASLLSSTLLEYLAIQQSVDEKTVKELLTALTDLVTDYARKPTPKGWPRSPQALTAHLKRIAPALRREGWTVTFHGHSARGSTLSLAKNPPSPPDEPPDEPLTNSGTQKSSSESSSVLSASNGAANDELTNLTNFPYPSLHAVEREERKERENEGETQEKAGEAPNKDRKSSSSSSLRQAPAPTLAERADEVADELLTNFQSSSASPAHTATPAFESLTATDLYCATCQQSNPFRTVHALDDSEGYYCATCDTEVGRKTSTAAFEEYNVV